MTRKEYLHGKKEQGQIIFGVFPGNYPREILWAFDIIPVEIWDPENDSGLASVHLQPYICSVVKAGLEFVHSEAATIVDAYLFPHTCDSIQNLSSLVNDFILPDKSCHFFYIPKEPYGDGSRKFYKSQLQTFAASLEETCGHLNIERLYRAVQMGRKIRFALSTLYTSLAESSLDITNREFYRILRRGEYFSPEDYLAELNTLTERKKEFASDIHKPTVILSGILPNPPEVLDLLDEIGIRVGGDDFLALGRRIAQIGEGPLSGDPWEELTRIFFSLPPCSTRGTSIQTRALFLKNLLRESNAAGIIFWIVKHCETELFDVPLLVEEMKQQKGVRVLTIETELNEGLSGQLRTRIEAFAETLLENT